VTRKAKILVIDDTPANVKLLADLLTVKGYEVFTAANGEDGLKRLASERPDLVLLDVMMPGMNGYDVCRAIRADAANGILPVVMVTSLDPAQERIKGLDAGADDFLTKPINQPELLARVRSLLRIKDLYDQLGALNASLEQRVAEQVKQIERFGRLKRFVSPRSAS
jgi:DNA-binding response OmpR family regulator